MRAIFVISLAACSFPRPADVGPAGDAALADVAIADGVSRSDGPPMPENAQLLSFSFPAPANSLAHDIVGKISGTNVDLYGFGVSPASLVVAFTATPGATVKALGFVQTTGMDTHDFTAPVTYSVSAENSSDHTDYTVTFHARRFAGTVIHPTKSLAAFAVGDLDGDQRADIVLGASDGSLLVYHNTGTAVGSVALVLNTGIAPVAAEAITAMAFADLDGDHKPDMIVVGGNNVEVFRNTSVMGTISFAPSTKLTFGATITAVAAGDLDGNGTPDLAATNGQFDHVTIGLNNSPTDVISFEPAQSFVSGGQAVAVAFADFNADTKADVLVVDYDTARVSLITNTTLSTNTAFVPGSTQPLTVPAGPTGLAVADLRGTGILDAIVATSGAASFSVIHNTGGMATVENHVTTAASVAVAALDLDEDIRADVIALTYVPSLGHGTIEPFVTTSDGSFVAEATMNGEGTPLALATGDFDADGILDLAMLEDQYFAVYVLTD